jgi:hypothetical protein
MSHQNYTIEVISHHPTFKNKSLRQYYIDGINTVGAWGDEPFEIKFKNNTGNKVQVKLSLDGTDVFSGELASTDVTKDMWMVNAYGTLSLKAWPETNNGGAALIFTSATNSVAVHTHGDMSSRGIIAAAVFTEGHIEPIRYNPIVIQTVYPSTYFPYRDLYSSGSLTVGGDLGITGVYTSNSIAFNSSEVSCDVSPTRSKSLESVAAVGAGQHVDQKISYVAGLIKPVFSESIRIRYMWWDDLVVRLKVNNVPAPHASGFPADIKKTNINLGSTPRMGQSLTRETLASSYLRV